MMVVSLLLLCFLTVVIAVAPAMMTMSETANPAGKQVRS